MDTPSETSILWTLIISSALARNGCLGNKILTIEWLDASLIVAIETDIIEESMVKFSIDVYLKLMLI